MNEFRTDVERLFIRETDSILDALRRLEATRERLLICVADNRELVGVVADGDIRRRFLAGDSLSDPIASAVQRNPVFISDQASLTDAAALITVRVHLIPVVDAHHRVVGFFSYQQSEALTERVHLNRTAIIGMGYVGLTLAVSFASIGLRVVGYDLDRNLIDKLNTRRAPFFEIGLSDMLEKFVGQNLTFVADPEDLDADIFIVAVGTPVSKASMQPDLTSIKSAAETVGRHLNKNGAVIMRSTMPVGCSRNVVLPVLEKTSGLVGGRDFYFAVAPERTVEGRALPELRSNPQIVGGIDRPSISLASRLFNMLTKSVVNVDSLEAAELSKLMDNCFRDHIFAFANQLAMLTEELGLDMNRLVEAANFGYSRNRIPRPSPGVGGPCLSKDPYILASVFNEHGLDPSLMLNARKLNEDGPHRVADKLEALLARAGKPLADAKVSLVGIAFKGEPETSDTRDSTSLAVLERLRAAGELCAYDPVVEPSELAALGVRPVELAEAFKGSDAVVVLNNHRSYQNWNLSQLLHTMSRPAVFLDTWQIFDPLALKTTSGILYGGVGTD